VADLATSMTDNAATLSGTDQLTFHVVVTNTGPSTVFGAYVSAQFGQGVVSGNLNGSASNGALFVTPELVLNFAGDYTNAIETSTVASDPFYSDYPSSIEQSVYLPPGGIITFDFTPSDQYQQYQNFIFQNTASVDVPQGVTDPVASNNSSQSNVIPPAHVELSVNVSNDAVVSSLGYGFLKTTPTNAVLAGTSTTYTLSVRNSGPNNVTGATLSDILPPAILRDTFTATGSVGASGFTTSGSGNVSDQVNLKAGAWITYTIVANIDPLATGSIQNTATITSPMGFIDTDTSNNTSTDDDPIVPPADVSVTVADSGAPVSPGSNVTYTITVKNNGPNEVDGANIVDYSIQNISLAGAQSDGAYPLTDSHSDSSITSQLINVYLTNFYLETDGSYGPYTVTAFDGYLEASPQAGRPYETAQSYTAIGIGGASGFTAHGTGNIDDTVNLPAGASIVYTVIGTLSPLYSGSLQKTVTVSMPNSVVDTNPANNTASDFLSI
jgi:uncharacterized repeat protein (TIGR01451 family)